MYGDHLRPIRALFALALTLTIPSAFAAINGRAAPPTSASLTYTSMPGDVYGLGDGRPHGYTSPSYRFDIGALTINSGATTPGYLDVIVGSSDSARFPNPSVRFGLVAPGTQALIPGTYAIGSSVGTHSASASGSFNGPGTGCIGPTDQTTGTIVVTRARYEIVPLGDTKFTAFHPLEIQLHFELRCKPTDGLLSGDFSMTDKSLGGTPYDPTKSGGGGGGTPTPTPTPSPNPNPTPTPTPQPVPTIPIVFLSDDLRAAPIVMANGATSTTHFSTFVPDTTVGNVTLSASSDADNLIASIAPSVLTATGTIDSVLTIRTTATTAAGDHAVTITATAPDGSSSSATVFVTVLCDPPFILGIDQPKSSTVSAGRPAQLSVKASGSGPFTYQWFTGASGLVNFPLAGGTSANFTTSALNDTTSYWVRVTNPCGSVDSQTATVNVSASAKPAGRR